MTLPLPLTLTYATGWIPLIPYQNEHDWHVDGWHDPHQVTSPDVGLVCLWLLTPAPRGGGGTVFSPGSAAHVARLLAGSTVPPSPQSESEASQVEHTASSKEGHSQDPSASPSPPTALSPSPPTPLPSTPPTPSSLSSTPTPTSTSTRSTTHLPTERPSLATDATPPHAPAPPPPTHLTGVPASALHGADATPDERHVLKALLRKCSSAGTLYMSPQQYAFIGT